jgi:hypothetical protein
MGHHLPQPASAAPYAPLTAPVSVIVSAPRAIRPLSALRLLAVFGSTCRPTHACFRPSPASDPQPRISVSLVVKGTADTAMGAVSRCVQRNLDAHRASNEAAEGSWPGDCRESHPFDLETGVKSAAQVHDDASAGCCDPRQTRRLEGVMEAPRMGAAQAGQTIYLECRLNLQHYHQLVRTVICGGYDNPRSAVPATAAQRPTERIETDQCQIA